MELLTGFYVLICIILSIFGGFGVAIHTAIVSKLTNEKPFSSSRLVDIILSGVFGFLITWFATLFFPIWGPFVIVGYAIKCVVDHSVDYAQKR